MTDLNPHMKQMADESMVRTLSAQTRAIWPQESKLFARYALSGELNILDAGCGTGRHAVELAKAGARVTGVDFSNGMLEKARQKASLAKVEFVLDLGDANRLYDEVWTQIKGE